MGGTDDINNLVKLTPEEHYIAHQLLVKIYPNNRILLSALTKMRSFSNKNIRNNKMYGCIRKKWSIAVSGENNPSAKFTNAEVIEIYHSNEDLNILAIRYNVNRYNIITIKRKIYYKSVTKDITVLPGFPEVQSYTSFPIPIDLIPAIFYDSGTYAYFWEKYKASQIVVNSIKNKKSFKRITSKLNEPGQIKRYNLSNNDIEDIILSNNTCKNLATMYGVHTETIRNIKKGATRAGIWSDF
jgi:hypothetical protein